MNASSNAKSNIKNNSPVMKALKSVSALTLPIMSFAGTMLMTSPAMAIDANTTPQGGTVVGGSASFDRPADNVLNVHQGSDRVLINWDSFNIGQDATTQFYQPGSSSIAVNRVIAAGSDPTQILGTLKSNGQVMVLDRNGVFFGKDARIDVGGIVASTGDLADPSGFINGGEGSVQLTNFGEGAVENHGLITVAEGGLAALVAPTVINNGIITAKMGKVELAAGNTTATVDLYGDGLVEFEVTDAAKKAVVENSGVIDAEAGIIALTTGGATAVVDSVINLSGVAKASSASVQGGKIVLGGTGATVTVSGTADASGKQGGGSVTVKGKKVDVTRTAELKADATTTGNGGTVKMLGDETALFTGKASAKGGSESGDGGFIELSANDEFLLGGIVDTTAANGSTGTFLLDPRDIDFRLGERNWDLTTNRLYESDIEFLSNFTDIDILARRNITVNADIFGTSDGIITINGGNDLTIRTSNINGWQMGDLWPVNEANNAGTINLTGNSTYGANLEWKTTGDGSINIHGATGGDAVSNIVLSKLTTENGGITVTTNNGSIEWKGAVTTQGGTVTGTATGQNNIGATITTDSGDVFLTGGGANFWDTGVLLAHNGRVLSNSGDITLNANNTKLVINGQARTISGDLDVIADNQGRVEFWGAGVLEGDNVNIESGLGITQGAAGKVIAKTLTAKANQSIELSGQNEIDALGDVSSGSATHAGGITLHDTNGFIVRGQVTTQGGNIGVTTNSSNFAHQVQVANNAGILSRGGDITINNNGASGGFVTLAGNGTIDARGASGTGDVTLNARQLQANGSSTIYADVLTTTGGLVNQQAGSTIKATRLTGSLTQAADFRGTNNEIRYVDNFTTGTGSGAGGFLLNNKISRMDVTGTVAADGGNITITNSHEIRVNGAGALKSNGGDINVANTSNAFIYVDGAVDATGATNGDVNINSRSNIELRGGSTVKADNFHVTSGNVVTQAAGSTITAASLTGAVDKSASFAGVNNDIGTLGNFATGVSPYHAGGLTLTDTNGLDIDGAVTTRGGNVRLNVTGDVEVASGGSIDAKGGNIDIDQTGIFASVDANTLKTSGTGTIDIQQRAGGSIGNAIRALENTGTGLNTVTVGDGTYTENVVVDQSNLYLVSENGRAATTIEGIANGAEATVLLGGVNNVTIGDTDRGFTIQGIDNPSPGIESAAVYLKGAHDNVTIRDNEIVANGDLGLLSLYGVSNSNLTIDNNIFSGKTYAGASWATGNQWTVPNVSRQLISLNPGASNVVFTNNIVNGDSGANTQVTIDSIGATITGNTFEGTTTDGYALRTRGTNADISGNTFKSAGLTGNAGYILAGASSLGNPSDMAGVFAANTFDGNTVYADAYTSDQVLHRKIQPVVNAAATGTTVHVSDGTFVENVTINKSLSLLSQNGRGSTTIEGIANGAEATLLIAPGVNNVTIGDTGRGFTIQGIDNPSPGIESGAVYLQGAHDGVTIRDNEIVANGDLGLFSQYGFSNANLVIDGNTFSGKTYTGASWATGDQWTVPNVSRQLVAINPGASNVAFTNNIVNGDSGANTQVTIDANGATITGNSFEGTTTGGYALRARGTNSDISGNTFKSAGLTGNAGYVLAGAASLGNPSDMAGVLAANTFDGNTVYADAYTTDQVLHRLIQPVVNAAAVGTTVHASAGTFVEQVNIGKNLTLQGAGQGNTIIEAYAGMTQGFTTSGLNKPIIYAHDADNIVITDLTVDGKNLGNGNNRFTGIGYYNAGGAIENVTVHGLTDTPFSGTQHGNAILAYNQDGAARTLNVTNNTVHDFQKNGITFTGAGLDGVIAGNTVTGSGVTATIAQNGIQVGDGAKATVDGNTISDIGYSPRTWAATGILINGAASGTSVVNNTIHGAGDDIGIYVYDTDGVTVSGNSLDGNSWVGIELYAADNATVSRNTVSGAEYAVDVYDSNNVLISENFISGDTAVSVGGTSNGVTVFNNSLDGTTALVDNSSANIVNASGNWWNTTDEAAINAKMVGQVDFSPYLALGTDVSATQGFQGDFSRLFATTLGAQSGTTGRIQEAVELIADGSLTGGARHIKLNAGTYSERDINVDKSVTIDGWHTSDSTLTKVQGAGAGNGFNFAADDITLRYLVVDGFVNGLYTNSAIDNLFMRNVHSVNNTNGFNIHNNAFVTNLDMRNVRLNNNSNVGLRVRGSVDGASISNGAISGNNTGINAIAGNGETNIFNNVTITGTIFANNKQKGIYAEKLSNATLKDIEIRNSGTDTAYGYNSGIDINLKHGDYSNITLDNVNVNGSGANPASGATAGSGIAVKARNDGAYAGNPASLTNLTIKNSSVTATGDVGVAVGNNVNGVSIKDNTISAKAQGVTVYGGVANTTIEGNTVTTTGTGSGTLDTAPASSHGIGVAGGTGTNVIRANTVNGHGGSTGIAVANTANVRIGGSAADGNTVNGAEYGIAVDGSADAVIGGNTVADATGTQTKVGILVNNSNSAFIGQNLSAGIAGNVVSSGSEAGIRVTNSNQTRIIGNNVSDANNTGDGADIGIDIVNAGGSSTVVTGNTASQRKVAIQAADSRNVQVTFNQNIDNNGTGIRFVNTTDSRIENNRVTNGAVGIEVGGTSNNVTVHNNTIGGPTGGNSQYGLLVSGANAGYVQVTDNFFINNATGARFESGEIDLSNVAAANRFNGGSVGIQLAPVGLADTLTLVGDTLGTTRFTGQSDYYIRLEDNAYFFGGAPFIIDALNASFDGVVPAMSVYGPGILTLAQYNAIKGKIYDLDDAPGRGQIFAGYVPGMSDEDMFPNGLGTFGVPGSGFSLTITALPNVPGTGGANIAAILNNLAPFAGGESSPEALANISPAAGGDAASLNSIEPASGENAACWSQVSNVVGVNAVTFNFGSEISGNLEAEASCGS